jgi:putative addiction module killer protein
MLSVAEAPMCSQDIEQDPVSGFFPTKQRLPRTRPEVHAAVTASSLFGHIFVTIHMSFEVREHLLEDGTSPFGRWFDGLDGVAAAKVRVALARIEQGNLSRVLWFRGIGEFRIDWGPGLRIYLARDDERIILLLGGGSKKRQQRDINLAVDRWERHKERKAKRDRRTCP